MWVWQSQAPAGTSKFTGVAGWEALGKPVRMCIVAPAAIAPIRISRRVSMGFLLGWKLIRFCPTVRRTWIMYLARRAEELRPVDAGLAGPVDRVSHAHLGELRGHQVGAMRRALYPALDHRLRGGL